MFHNAKYLHLLIAFLFIILFIGCPIINASSEDGEDIDIEDYLSNIEGTWQGTESTRSFTINSLHVLFQYPNPIPPGETVTYGNFEYVSYNGTTVYILDYDDEVVSFNATFDNDILTISGLNTIKIFDEPFDPRDYRSWNTTYAK